MQTAAASSNNGGGSALRLLPQATALVALPSPIGKVIAEAENQRTRALPPRYNSGKVPIHVLLIAAPFFPLLVSNLTSISARMHPAR